MSARAHEVVDEKRAFILSLAKAPLKPVELDVLRMMADGMTNRAIASALMVSPHTVDGYVIRLYDQLGAKNRAHAVALGIRLRYIV